MKGTGAQLYVGQAPTHEEADDKCFITSQLVPEKLLYLS